MCPPPPLIPDPRGDQLLPSHWAMALVMIPPAPVKEPPAYMLPPDFATAMTGPFKAESPGAGSDQLFPSHLAIELAAMPPAAVNTPPAYNLPPDSARAATLG